jgi:isopenicillin N synthase-like dioxygenase
VRFACFYNDQTGEPSVPAPSHSVEHRRRWFADSSSRNERSPMASNVDVPLVDISSFQDGTRETRASLARIVDGAFTGSGFMVITNHGIPDHVITDAKAMARLFFTNSDGNKIRLRQVGDGSHGYFPRNTIASAAYGDNKDAPADLMESYAVTCFAPPPWAPGCDVGRVAGVNVWPVWPADFQPIIERYFLAVEGLVSCLLRLLALGLGLDEDFFVPFYSPYIGVLRTNLYGRQTAVPLPDQFRIGPHTDLGGFTVLSADASCGGLQIRDTEGDWHDVTAPEHSFVINLGDLMQTWTNDRWRATVHRVANPATPAQNVDRLTLAFFANPRPDTICQCIPTCLEPGQRPHYAPLIAGEFRKRRMVEQHVAGPGEN